MYQFWCWFVSGLIITSGIAFILSMGAILGGVLIVLYEGLDYIVNTLRRHWCLFAVISLYLLLKDKF